jgi:hypothetical protein
MEDDYMKALWELFLRSISEPLRLSFIVAFGILAAQIYATKILLQMEYRDVILGSYFLTTVTVLAIALGIQILKHSQGAQSLLAFSASLVFGIGTGILAWKEWQYVYDPIGVYELRHWRNISEAGDRQILFWKLKAALNNPITITLHVNTTNSCPQVTIQSLHPVFTGPSLGGGETGEQSKSGRAFSFAGFQRPAELSFLLTLANTQPYPKIEQCFSYDLGVAEKSTDAPDGSEEKPK